GEGGTYWPLAGMVKAAAGITDDDPMETGREKLIECWGDEAIAELLGLASGVLESVEGERGQPEIAWAAREFVDELADVQPLVLVFEDIHWAEEPLLELIDHLAQWVRERALLIPRLARPEPLGARASARHLGGKPAVRRGDRAHGSGERRRRARPDPGHAAGAHRRAHRQASGKLQDPAAACLGARPRVRGERARGSLTGLRRRSRGRPRRPPRARPADARDAVGVLGRHRVPVQARPDPRGRLLGAVEILARRVPPEVRRVAAGARGQGAARNSRVPSGPRDAAARRARRPAAARPGAA